MQLIHGDCLEEMSNIPDKSIDMILCDLPYGMTDCSWDKQLPLDILWMSYRRIIKKEGAIVLFAGNPFNYNLYFSNPKWFKYEFIWDKVIPGNIAIANKMPLRVHEYVMVFGSSNTNYYPQFHNDYTERFGRASTEGEKTSITSLVRRESGKRGFPRSIIRFMRPNNFTNGGQHSTQKPTALLEYLIKTYTNEGDTVLDNCMGSGSTGIACLNTKRDFIGIELYPLLDRPISKDNPDYFGIAEKRIARHKFEPINDDSKNGHVILF